MSVFVDKARNPLGRMLMAHMMADTTDELLSMAHAIGLDRRWIQRPGQVDEHFDVSQRMKKRAIDRGAVEVSSRDLVGIIRARRAKLGIHLGAR